MEVTNSSLNLRNNNSNNLLETRDPSFSRKRRIEIRDIWADNLEDEMEKIRRLIEKYPFVAMDTEFPGVVACPASKTDDYQYQAIRCNVDVLKVIQVGLCFSNEKGQFPDGCYCWQFHFKFDLKSDVHSFSSIELLKSSGIDFEKHKKDGIDVLRFGELLMTSGLVLVDNVKWISFHSGYDFAYLVRILTAQHLPREQSEFFDLLRTFFPNIYDIKSIMYRENRFIGGLNKLAEDMQVERYGPVHQAGSDSLLTLMTFFKIINERFGGYENFDSDSFNGELHGLDGHSVNNYSTNFTSPSYTPLLIQQQQRHHHHHQQQQDQQQINNDEIGYDFLTFNYHTMPL